MKNLALVLVFVFTSLTGFSQLQRVKDINQKYFISNVFDFKNNKEWKYKGDKPLIIDFHATWCGPCKKLSPILETLNRELTGKVNFIKIDVDKETELAKYFNIRSMPTLIYVPVKGDYNRVLGLMNAKQIKNNINKFFKMKIK